MPFARPAAILFDVDGTLLDDDLASAAALASFHATYCDILRHSQNHIREPAASLEGIIGTALPAFSGGRTLDA